MLKRLHTASWMSQLKEQEPLAEQLRLSALVIPGSHDSATSAMSEQSDFAPDRYAHQFLQKVVPGLPRRFLKKRILGWSKAQTLSITEQLEAGLRYFDIRAAFRSADQMLLTCHGLYAQPLFSVLDEIAAYVKQHPDEILILDFQHFHRFTRESHHRLMAKILAQLGKQLIPPTADSQLTLGKIWSQKKQILLFYGDQQALLAQAKYKAYFWLRSRYLYSPWPQKQSVGALKDALQALSLRRRQQGSKQFFVLQAVLTPDLTMILKGLLFQQPRSLKDLALLANHQALDWLRKGELVEPNIVIFDFVELNKNFLPLIWQLNSKKVRALKNQKQQEEKAANSERGSSSGFRASFFLGLLSFAVLGAVSPESLLLVLICGSVFCSAKVNPSPLQVELAPISSACLSSSTTIFTKFGIESLTANGTASRALRPPAEESLPAEWAQTPPATRLVLATTRALPTVSGSDRESGSYATRACR